MVRPHWVLPILLTGALALSGCGLVGRDIRPPLPYPTPAATGEAYEFFPMETTVTFDPQPDGTVLVEQVVLFEAGPADGRLQTGIRQPTRILQATDRSGWHVIRPLMTEIVATDITVPDQPVQLATVSGSTDYSINTDITHPAGWSPGRHRVRITFRLSGVWAEIPGDRRLVLPEMAVHPEWYYGYQTGDVTRFATSHGEQLWCGGDRAGYGPAEPCPDQKAGQVVVGGRIPRAGETTSGNRRYFFLREPAGVTAPANPTEWMARQ